MNASPPAIGSETAILELNDDCLREVFEYLNTDDLAAIADVCTRFRPIAVESGRSKFKEITIEHLKKGDYSRVRNFGALFDSVHVYGSNAESNKRVIELLSWYCVGKSIRLTINKFDMTDEIARLMVPLLGRVNNLEFAFCEFDEVLLLKNLPLWSTELRQLAFSSCNTSNFEKMGAACLHQKFPNLEHIRLHHLDGVKNQDIAEFLKHNRQLKRIEVRGCPELDDSMFQSIAEYVPKFEEIKFNFLEMPINATNTKYLGQLRELKSLTIQLLNVADSEMYTQLIVHEIASANIALEHLLLPDLNFNDDIVKAISKLRKLKSLKARPVKNMTVSRLIEMCKPLEDLSELVLHTSSYQLTKDDLLTIIQNLESLQKFAYSSANRVEQNTFSRSIKVDFTTYNKIVEIVERRIEKKPLRLYLIEPDFPDFRDIDFFSPELTSNLVDLLVD